MSSSTPTASSSTSASTSKVKLASSSLLALKAEITRKTATTLSSSSSSSSYTRGLPSSTAGPKPISPWHRSNAGLAARQAKDQIVSETDLDQTGRINTVRSNLEQKASLYERIKKGKDLGVDNHKLSQLLVDFEAKEEQTDSEGEPDSSEEQEDSDQAQVGEDPRNPMVEYLDEFGRSHRVPRSDVPAGTALPSNVPSQVSPADKVYYGDQRHFPVYEPDPEKLAAIARENQRSRGALVDRYDATKEKRTRGAGFIALGMDDSTRRERMESLKEIRREGVQAREALESVGGVQGKREADKEERKRMLRHKRDEVQAKRNKLTEG
ncbi:BZ3500_MvSof-1268-A1-R1_Chr11-3g03545 [Microbotryum saponariae]|uniref:BZ3500_MvSof-1268-A1-R1_Chr11-3g03545 protein n=1 Tax=Microbotryum saponariae TaxID=289078 RepID=A0A2X0MSP1_9BASI|nr:BZ3500_MvSof-1268-A1-R1_Chr11-3g03545 [Microbotryum saponariae]SDA03554.1 BZ3501_MvSof-1269-A2-R1_Chr11g03122 [Microbotryum saponariae]